MRWFSFRDLRIKCPHEEWQSQDIPSLCGNGITNGFPKCGWCHPREIKEVRKELDTSGFMWCQRPFAKRVDESPLSATSESAGNGRCRTIPPHSTVNPRIGVRFEAVAIRSLRVGKVVQVVLEEVVDSRPVDRRMNGRRIEWIVWILLPEKISASPTQRTFRYLRLPDDAFDVDVVHHARGHEDHATAHLRHAEFPHRKNAEADAVADFAEILVGPLKNAVPLIKNAGDVLNDYRWRP